MNQPIESSARSQSSVEDDALPTGKLFVLLVALLAIIAGTIMGVRQLTVNTAWDMRSDRAAASLEASEAASAGDQERR